MHDMTVIIPAKTSSTRVPNKNYRHFFRGMSLVDIAIQKLLAVGFDHNNIFLSCEDEKVKHFSTVHGIRFHHRDTALADNDCNKKEVNLYRGILEDLAYLEGIDITTRTVMWFYVCDPLLSTGDLKRALAAWKVAKLNAGYDTLSLYRRNTGMHLIDDHGRPMGWGYGPWHVNGQDLKPTFTMPFSFTIIKAQASYDYGYMLGSKIWWYEGHGPWVDIDEEQDFETAQVLYKHYEELIYRD